MTDSCTTPRPTLDGAAFEIIERVLTEKNYWCPATLAATLGAGWHVEFLETQSRRWYRLKRLRRRAEAACAARLSEVITEKGMSGDKNAAMAALKNLHGWTPGREAGGAKLTEPQRAGLAIFADLSADAE